jgi:predicted O-methyltransferase YrrM
LFIDATKEEYLVYLKHAEKYLVKGAVVLADNVGIFEKQMLDYLEYVRNSERYRSHTIQTKLEFTEDVNDAIELSIKIV